MTYLVLSVGGDKNQGSQVTIPDLLGAVEGYDNLRTSKKATKDFLSALKGVISVSNFQVNFCKTIR
jgi:hypothetical protein